jgi:ABC-type branched-subunit amino acid transport system ATPase component
MTKVDKLADKDIMILLKNKKKQFGSLIALSNINFEIKKGEIIGFFRTNWSRKIYNYENNGKFD